MSPKQLNRVTAQIEQARNAAMNPANTVFMATYSSLFTFQFTGPQIASLIAGIEGVGWKFTAWNWRDIPNTNQLQVNILFHRSGSHTTSNNTPLRGSTTPIAREDTASPSGYPGYSQQWNPPTGGVVFPG